MSGSVKLRTRSQWRHVLPITSSMMWPRLWRRFWPPGDKCAWRSRDRWGGGCGNRLRCSHRENLQNSASRNQQEVQVKIRKAEECARHQERIERQLVHLRVVRQVAILGVPLPPASDASQGNQGGGHDRDVQAEPDQTVLGHHLAVQAVDVAYYGVL